MNLTKDAQPLAIGDRYLIFPGGALYDRVRDVAQGETVTTRCGMTLRLDERRRCGALEFVVIGLGAPPPDEDDGA
jgi:hypothetical protein